MVERIPCPEPGVYDDVPFATYLAWDAASNSRLGKLVPPSTPAHLKAYLEEPAPSTKAQREGRVLHACVLEPDVFEREYRLADQCIATTKKGAQCSKPGNWPIQGGGWLCTTHLDAAVRAGEAPTVDDDVVTMSEKELALATRARDAIQAHPVAAGFLRAEDGQTELSLVWDDPATGVRCKARIDFYSRSTAGGTLMDLKGTTNASVDFFTRDAFKYGYFRQGAFYLTGANELGLPAAHYAILAVEKTAPFAMRVHRITEQAVGYLPPPDEPAFHYARQMRALLKLYERCMTSGDFPAYPEGPHDLSLEEWQWSMMDAQTQIIEELAA